MDEWVWSNGGMVLTGENWSTGRKTCQWQMPHGLSELHPPFALSEQWLTSQIRNVKILFRCYIACKDSHIIDKMCLIIICNWRIILKEVLVRVSLGLDDFSIRIGRDGRLLWAWLWTYEFYIVLCGKFTASVTNWSFLSQAATLWTDWFIICHILKMCCCGSCTEYKFMAW